MTTFKAEAYNTKEHPTRLDHTFFVETVTCDEAAARARVLAAQWPPNVDHEHVPDTTLWVYLGRASSFDGPMLGPEARAFQRSWLRDHAGMAESDKVVSSVRGTTTFTV